MTVSRNCQSAIEKLGSALKTADQRNVHPYLIEQAEEMHMRNAEDDETL